MKIVISANTSWYIYNFRLGLARALKEKGYEVIIVAPYDKYSDKLSKEFKYYDIFINRKGINPIQDFKTFLMYYKIYKNIKPKVALHFTIKPNIYGTLACALLGIKSIVTITGLGYTFSNTSWITKLVKFLYKFALSKADKVFFQNKDDYELFIKENLVEKNKCEILPGSGVNTSIFSPMDIKKDNENFRFLLIGRMLWDKGIGEYVEAAKLIKEKYSNVEFFLLGQIDDNYPKAISKTQIEKWEKEGIIKYLGVKENVKEEIAKADCIVLPSYREGIPRALLEAASMEKPIITTDVPGCREVVDDGINGFLCKPKDSKDLAKKMEKMLNLKEEERIKMGKKGREKVIKSFDEKIVIQKYLDAIKELLKTSN